MLQIDDVRCRLGDGYTVIHETDVDSTNDRAMELAHAGVPAGTLVSADFQTAGRGRRGAAWVAPPGSSVLASLVVRLPVMPPASHLAILTGVGVANSLLALDIPVAIKWPNDIMVLDRKVAGILVETTGDAAVIGVGVNCTVEEFPDDLRDRAGSLHALMDRPISREDVLVAVAKELTAALDRVREGGILRVLVAWNKMNWLMRRRVRVSGPLGVVDGDGLFLDGRQLAWHVFRDGRIVTMPLSSAVEPL
jgi:BirA family biotin operon repressor/biotin-[acetyl-CoA-carboxylase] ligase